MSKKAGRQRRALARLEKQLAPTLVLPLSQEQAKIWRLVISLRTKLGLLTDTDRAVEKSLQ